MKGRAFPLHRDAWSRTKLWAHQVGIVAAVLVAVLGLMTAGSIARKGTQRDAAIVLAIAAVGAGAGVYALGRRLSWLRPEDGLVAIHQDHLVICDAVLQGHAIVLPRDTVVDILQLTAVTPPPRPGTMRADGVVALIGTGGEWPNVEIWVSRPVDLPPGLAVRDEGATRLQLRTPGAAALLRWRNPSTPLLPGDPRVPPLMSWRRYSRPDVDVRRDGTWCYTEDVASPAVSGQWRAR